MKFTFGGSARRAGLAGLAALTLAAVPAAASAQTAPFGGDLPPQGGVALLITTQDIAPADLNEALLDEGCQTETIAITFAGSWVLYSPDAPDFVNERFPATLSADRAFAVNCTAVEDDGDDEASEEATAEDAVRVLELYFANLDAGDHEAAYGLWRDGQNEQSLEEFTEGYAETESVSVEVGEPGRIDAGAGQRYIEIPVVVTSTLEDGTEQVFEGPMVLHHTADIPGATDEQKEWRIYSAELEQTS